MVLMVILSFLFLSRFAPRKILEISHQRSLILKKDVD